VLIVEYSEEVGLEAAIL